MMKVAEKRRKETSQLDQSKWSKAIGESFNSILASQVHATIELPSYSVETRLSPMSPSTFDDLLRGYTMMADNYLLVENIGRKFILPGDQGRLDAEDDDNDYHHAMAMNLEAMTAIQARKERFHKLHGAFGELQAQNILLITELGNMHSLAYGDDLRKRC